LCKVSKEEEKEKVHSCNTNSNFSKLILVKFYAK